MLSPRTLLTILMAVFVFNLTPRDAQAQIQAQFSGLIPRQINALLDRYEVELNAVLKTRLPEEKEFVNEVVNEIRAGILPKPVVDSSWLWIRNNRPYTNYPFVYFERILRLQGKRLGLPVPPFDREIYSSRNARLANQVPDSSSQKSKKRR